MVRLEPLGAGFLAGSKGVGSHRLAEGEEGASEAQLGGSGGNTTLTRVVGLQSEAIDRGGEAASVGSVGRFGKSREATRSQRWRFPERRDGTCNLAAVSVTLLLLVALL
jgi:hypothetical protein